MRKPKSKLTRRKKTKDPLTTRGVKNAIQTTVDITDEPLATNEIPANEQTADITQARADCVKESDMIIGESLHDVNEHLPAKVRKIEKESVMVCICYVVGPASRRCPLHEANIVEEDQQNQSTLNIPESDYLADFLENVGFNTPITPEGMIDEYADTVVAPILNENVDIQIDNNDNAEGEDNPFINQPLPRQDYLRATNHDNVEILHCGGLNGICPFCRAKFFMMERTQNGTYGKCCSNGKVFLPPYQQYSEQMQRLYRGEHPLSRQFKRDIITYNNLFQFASIQANLREIPGRGPYVYAIQGQVYHHYTDINVNRNQQRYGSVYFLNPEEAVQQRIVNAGEFNVHRELVALLEHEMQMTNPYAQQYRHLGQMYEEQRLRAQGGEVQIPRVFLEFVAHRRNENRREHDLPQVREIAVIAQYNENEPPNLEMKVFLTNRDGHFRIINHESEHSDPLTFPLLFPNGELGWTNNIRLRNVNPNGRQRVTLAQYYSYRLAIRDDDQNFNVHKFAGRLNQKYIVSTYLKIEANRLRYIRFNQDALRAAEYQGLVDHLQNRGERENAPIGRMIILPSTYQMSPRNQMQRFQDAMAIVSKVGYPTLFITITCNPRWREIVENLPAGDDASNHPLLVCRVFKMKLEQLIEDLTKRHIMGVCISYLYVIEFQKRGLPHSHILITLRNEDKFHDNVRIDQLISAELPNPTVEPELYEQVAQNMIHGPCGMYNPANVCMVNGICTKNYPKYWYNNTTIRDGKINYRRRQNGRTVEVRRLNSRYVVDNSFVVPYNPYLLLKYRTHINVETCVNIGTVKYLYKYFFKGTDQITMEVVQRQDDDVPANDDEQRIIHHDEIKSYLNARYLSPPECSWYISQFDMHGSSHHVERLQIHLPGRQNIMFRDGQEQIAMNNNGRTQLLQWFETNRNNEFARQWLYTEFPIHYVWRNGRWSERQRTVKPIVPRLVNVSIRNGELYYLRLLLLHVRGATCFDDLKMVNGIIYQTFRESCQQRNLLSEDREWIRCLTEACAKDMPKQLRQMFAFILIFGIVDDAPALWRQFRQYLIEDFVRRQRFAEEDAEIAALQRIQTILLVNGRRLSHFGIDDPPQYNAHIEDNVDVGEERRQADEMFARLNDEQRNIFEMVMRAVENENEQDRLFYITGNAGTGKSYLFNTILTNLIARETKVMPVSTTGIAAALLKQGRTVHSRFQLPVPIVESSTSRIERQTDEAGFIRDAKLIIWDEVSMATRLAFELVDKTLRFLCNNNRPFGNKCIIIGGDFKQCLPIIQRGDRASIVQACIKSSDLWSHFRQLQLRTNMRVQPDEQHFIAWLNDLGNNTLPKFRNNLIEIPQECVVETLNDLIRNVFGDLRIGDVPNKAILTPLNEDCHTINQRILDSMQNINEVVYLGVDSVISDDQAEADLYPVEFLNSLTPSGFPQYNLKLKEGSVIMLLRNLNVRANLCNGTRLLVRHLGEHYIDGEIIQFDGRLSNERVFIPKVDFTTNNTSTLPFVMQRRQFPVRVSYCLTINKAQGQSFDAIGIYLPNAVFDHGQLYVAFSRARSMRNVFVCVLDTAQQGKSRINHQTYTKNIVYEEVL